MATRSARTVTLRDLKLSIGYVTVEADADEGAVVSMLDDNGDAVNLDAVLPLLRDGDWRTIAGAVDELDRDARDWSRSWGDADAAA